MGLVDGWGYWSWGKRHASVEEQGWLGDDGLACLSFPCGSINNSAGAMLYVCLPLYNRKDRLLINLMPPSVNELSHLTISLPPSLSLPSILHRCANTGKAVPKDKAIKRMLVRSIVDQSSARDIKEARVFENYQLPKLYIKQYYSVEAAVHQRLVRSRSKEDRRKRDPPVRTRPGGAR